METNVKLINCAATAALAFSLINSTQACAEALPQAHVSYADLNLSTEAGLKALNSRINAAIRGLCGDARSGMPLAEYGSIRECASVARRSAQEQIAAAVSGSSSQQALAQAEAKTARQ